MPWRKPNYAGEFPSLGWEVVDWIQAHCVIPDGDRVGEPYMLTESMVRWFVHYYRLNLSGTWAHPRGGQLVRPQKWGKSPLISSHVLVEAEGPVLFDGWDANGEPVGRPWATPHIQIAAHSIEQVDNTYRALTPMIDLGPLADIIPDTALTRINLQSGGIIEPVTAAASSRLGARITFAVFDETGIWVAHNGGHKLARTMRRGLAGMGGRAAETTNAYDPVEDSVAQRTHENPVGVYVDFPESPPGNVTNKAARRKVMKFAYGDAVKTRSNPQGWVDLDRIDIEVEAMLARDPYDAVRFFLNRIASAGGQAFDLDHWNKAGQGEPLRAGEHIALGIDGARSDDAIAIVGCSIERQHIELMGLWEQPANAGDDYMHPKAEVDYILDDIFDRYSVWRAYTDPQYIEGLVTEWQARHGIKTVIEWYTSRPRPMAEAVRRFASAVKSGELSHDGDADLKRHVMHARRRNARVRDDKGRAMWTVAKDRPGSPRKIDACVAAILAIECAADARAAGATKPKTAAAVGFGGRR